MFQPNRTGNVILSMKHKGGKSETEQRAEMRQHSLRDPMMSQDFHVRVLFDTTHTHAQVRYTAN